MPGLMSPVCGDSQRATPEHSARSGESNYEKNEYEFGVLAHRGASKAPVFTKREIFTRASLAPGCGRPRLHFGFECPVEGCFGFVSDANPTTFRDRE
jgi:hypothetical protein